MQVSLHEGRPCDMAGMIFLKGHMRKARAEQGPVQLTGQETFLRALTALTPTTLDHQRFDTFVSIVSRSEDVCKVDSFVSLSGTYDTPNAVGDAYSHSPAAVN
jgi:hypothetical protein